MAALLLLAALAVSPVPAESPLAWPEEQRAFLLDGPGLLLESEQRQRLEAATTEERGRWIEDFLGRDPIPETPENELRLGIERRRALVRSELQTFLDDRAKLLFLHGEPDARDRIDCDQVFVPLEIWGYGPEDDRRELVLYNPGPNQAWRLWLPLDSKRVLYSPEMEYWLEQYEELRGLLVARRFDEQLCDETRRVDRATGVAMLFRFRDDRPTNSELMRWLAPPADLEGWARAAAATPLASTVEELTVAETKLVFPAREGPRMVSRLTLLLPVVDNLESFEDEQAAQGEFRINVDGVLEQHDSLFDDFKVRFTVPRRDDPPAERLALVVERRLRPGQSFLLRLRIRDEVSGRVTWLARAFEVPAEPDDVPEPEVPQDVLVALERELAERPIAGADSILLIPPESDVVLGLWRAEALVTGGGIERVRFLVDGEVQMTRARPPFSAELRLAKYPVEQIVRVEGLDGEGEVLASDEVVLNQQRGELRIRIVEPTRGAPAEGQVDVSAEVVVPEERRIESVEFLVNGELQARLGAPPWEARVEVPAARGAGAVTYLTAVAVLDDGARAEDVRFLNVPDFVDEVEVDFVELYTTVTDRTGTPVLGLSAEDFRVFEDGRPQELAKFELVEDLPITVGITIDTSGSMNESLGEARRAAVDFLERIITPRDRSFAVSFSNQPVLLMPRTSDVTAVAESLDTLAAMGMTSLHDAVVTSLYYFRGVKGRRALVLLSDGEDTSSTIPYRDALEYARRSGVAIYTIGLEVGGLQAGVRGKLKELSSETGGRSFFIRKAEELQEVYGEIERELRSQYLLAYTSDRPSTETEEEDAFRTVRVEVEGRGLQARTISGYYP